MPKTSPFSRAGTAAFLLAAVLSVAACSPGGQGQAQGNMPPPEVGVVTLAQERVPLITELSGRTSAYLVSDVRPQVNGLIKSRLFTEGSYVRQGQSLYVIDPAPYEAQLQSAQAALAQARAAETSARLRAERYAELVKTNAVSRQENDDAQATLGQATAAVQAAQAQVRTAQINVGYTRVQAPISGRIGKSNVTQGALVTASQPTELARIQNIDTVYLDISQSVAETMSLQEAIKSGQVSASDGAEVELVFEDGRVYPLKGRLQFSDVSVDEATGSVTLRATFPNPEGVILPGMFAKARVTSGYTPNGILVPQPAVIRDPKGNASVFVIGKDGTAQPRPIKAVRTVGDKWLVTEGLAPGDKVIVEGLQKVQPGAPVTPVQIGAPQEKPQDAAAPKPAAAQ